MNNLGLFENGARPFQCSDIFEVRHVWLLFRTSRSTSRRKDLFDEMDQLIQQDEEEATEEDDLIVSTPVPVQYKTSGGEIQPQR